VITLLSTASILFTIGSMERHQSSVRFDRFLSLQGFLAVVVAAAIFWLDQSIQRTKCSGFIWKLCR